MKYKLLTAILIALMLLSPIMSAAAFWHPEVPDEVPECCDGIAVFGVLIEGHGTESDDRFNFTEPEYGYCTDITVEVWILCVEDLYGYEFKLWWDTDYFTLVDWVVEETWENQFVIKPEDDYDGARPYHQAVVAVAPSPGVTGDFKVTTLTFHIRNDICWVLDDVCDKFEIYAYEAKDSCTGEIELCTPLHGYYRLIPMQPKIYLDPKLEENCVIYDKFTMTIWVENIVKMKSVHFRLNWSGHYADYLGWRELIHLEEYVINEDVLPEAERVVEVIDEDQTAVESWLNVTIKMDCDFPLINGTFWLMELTFEKQDPWYCGGQPGYIIDKKTHEITTKNATTEIEFYYGYFDVYCPDLAYIYFGDKSGAPGPVPGVRGYAIHADAVYIFDTVPGDLTGDGVVDLDDLMIIASLYCFPTGFPDPYSPHSNFPAMSHAFWLFYYDFSGDGHIGLEEIIVVSKNFGRTCEEHTIPGDP